MMTVVVSADRCCLPSLLAIATIAVTMFPPSLGQSLTVTLNYTTRDNSECVGGESLGLTDTSALLQYRTVQDAALSSSAAPLSSSFDEWCDLATLFSPSHNSTHLQQTAELRGGGGGGGGGRERVRGVQFRLLQLEHGGDQCNCWAVREMSFTVGNLSHTWTDENDTCFASGHSSGEFCGGVAGKSRGRVSRVFFFLHDDDNNDVGSEMYCGNYTRSLFHPRVPSLWPAGVNCTEMTPRM